MNTLRRHRPLTWLAILAIALAACLPTLSRALSAPAAGQAAWLEVCSAAGMRWVSLQTGEIRSQAPPAQGDSNQPLLDACPYCVLAAERLAPPPTHPSLAFALGRPVVPGLTGAAPLLPEPPAFQRARGPPLTLS
ncbi:MAG: DUF2946 family protein [Burkholderiaceae bacterium]|nr:DUF2946 family protein [Burkholderiaceae bacterium]